ncbi:FkbM family methyltransferase [Actinomycetospora lutea]|uniref:FkbM family methyltransferase n=1 Tax=Actinomycetospora lutea TaxID=663604 RepID=UPI0023673E6B|nr:FkbM family methyltransferase [Actinomycetospora lutea]MDD7941978.1 FkbM family methyltransferase [Actinomycetospora lutea]
MSGGDIFLDSRSFFVDALTLSYLWNERVFEANFRGRVVLDLGAHKGFYAARALASGARHVVSIEPELRNFELLELARRSNVRSKDWELRRAAVGATSGHVTLHVSNESWAHTVNEEMIQSVGTQEVEMVTLAELLAGLPVHLKGDKIVLKVNVEGMAGGILLAATAGQLAAVAEIDLDVEPGSPFDLDALEAHLQNAGLVRKASSNGKILKFVR